jgi:hypothetical protein
MFEIVRFQGTVTRITIMDGKIVARYGGHVFFSDCFTYVDQVIYEDGSVEYLNGNPRHITVKESDLWSGSFMK